MKYEVIYPDMNSSEVISEDELPKAKKLGAQVIKSIPENVVDSDWIEGWAYPGHECWPDDY